MTETVSDAVVGGEAATKILDALQKDFTKMSELVDFCGPALVNERRSEAGSGDIEMDVPAVLRMIDRLIDAGYVERKGERFAAQLQLSLTKKGRETAPALTDTERELLADHGVSPEAFSVLEQVIKYQDAHGKVPTIGKLIHEFKVDLLAHQVSVLYNQLAQSGLAEERGLFRFTIEPTDEGRRIVGEYANGS